MQFSCKSFEEIFIIEQIRIAVTAHQAHAL